MATPNNFFTQLEARINAVNSHLCVGLDPHLKELFPNSTKDVDEYSEEEVSNASYEFCKRIIDATGEYENVNHLGLSSFKGVECMNLSSSSTNMPSFIFSRTHVLLQAKCSIF
jgi:hypothetical protein